MVTMDVGTAVRRPSRWALDRDEARALGPEPRSVDTGRRGVAGTAPLPRLAALVPQAGAAR